MFFVVILPFTDLRSFSREGAGRLPRPAWPLASPGVDFIRGVGGVKNRRRGGAADWAGEDLYCDASRAIRFPNLLGHQRFGGDGLIGKIRSSFRRFHSEGVVARLEVAFRITTETFKSKRAGDWLHLFVQLARLDVRVPKGNNFERAALVSAGRLLADHYLKSSTNRECGCSLMEPWWFSDGSPCLIVAWNQEKRPISVPHQREVLNLKSERILVSHAWLELGNQRISIWLIEGKQCNPHDIRRIRIHIARLHSERESLRASLVTFSDKSKIDIESSIAISNAVQNYLNRSTRAVKGRVRSGIDQGSLLDAARTAAFSALGDREISILQMRRQIKSKVALYLESFRAEHATVINLYGDAVDTKIHFGGEVNVKGPFNVVVAKNIQNSFNKVAESSAPEDLKSELKKLAVEVANLAKHLGEEDGEKVSRDLESLTSEALSAKPRKDWYELSAKGLVDAAKTVAEMAKPVADAVSDVLKILAP